MLIVAERINSSRKSIAQAIAARDREFITQEARSQAAAGAHYIDVNAGSFLNRETECLAWLIATVQEAVDRPLCIDSPNPAAIEAVLPLVRLPPMINSITLEPQRLESLLPLAVAYQAKVIGLCQAENRMADTVDARLKLTGELVSKVSRVGVSLDDLYIDPLVYPISTDTRSVLATLEAIHRIMVEFPGIHTVCGLTNVSHGLPARKLVNRTFLAAALTWGLDAVIIDPTDRRLYSTLKAGLMLSGRDAYCMGYIRAFRENRLE